MLFSFSPNRTKRTETSAIRPLPPAQFVFNVLTGFALIVFFIIAQMTNRPWLGVYFSPAPQEESGLTISSIAENSPAAKKLSSGQRIIALAGAQSIVPLNSHLLNAPDSFLTYDTFNTHLETQQKIADILAESSVTFIVENGEKIVLIPARSQPISTIPVINLFYLLSGFFSISVGLLLWRFRPHLFATRLILVASAGTLLYYLSVVLQCRELALSADWLRATAATSTLGTHLFAWGQISIFMTYPMRGFSNKAVWALLILTLLIILNSTLQWLELPLHTYLFHFLFVGAWFYYLLYLQWRITQKNPIEHAAIKLFILILAAPTVLVFMMWVIPLVLGLPTLISHNLARFIFVPVAIGWALAVLRFRLFNVELWWFKSILWMASGVLVLILDVILVYLLNLKPLAATSAALIIAGFLYFPLRQRLLFQLLPEVRSSLSDALPSFIQSLQTAATDTDFKKVWRQVLENRFHPVTTEYLPNDQKTISFRDEGLILHVPDVMDKGYYKLSGKRQGNGLFNTKDVKIVESLLALARAILKASRVREEAKLAERSRIMRDLHDSLGAKLLSMAQRCRGHESANDARDALQTLRDTVHLSTASEQLELMTLLGQWRMETQERVEITDAQLHWQVEGVDDDLRISSTYVLLLLGFLRETISNALKHAQPENVYVWIKCMPEELVLSVGNDGKTGVPKDWKWGFGLAHLRERIVRAGGELKISDRQLENKGGKLIEVHSTLPIQGYHAIN